MIYLYTLIVCVVMVAQFAIASDSTQGRKYDLTVAWPPVMTYHDGTEIPLELQGTVRYDVVICREPISDDGECSLGFYRQKIPPYFPARAHIFNYWADREICMRVRAVIEKELGRYSANLCIDVTNPQIPAQVQPLSATIY